MSPNQKQKAPVQDFDGSQPFDAADMERRWLRLKAEGRAPSLGDVLRIVKKVIEEGRE